MNAHAAETLQVKLQQFADGLTPEETAQLRLIQTDDVTGMLSTSLWDKAQNAIDTLTPEERAHLEGLLREVRAARGGEADTTGHMVNLYESNASDPTEGRPRPSVGVTGGGGSLLGPYAPANPARGFLVLASVVSWLGPPAPLPSLG